MFRSKEKTVWLEQFSDEELSIIDQDIRDLHFRLEDPMDVGINLALMSRTPPALLLEVGEAVETWDIDGEQADRVEIFTTSGTMTASQVGPGVSVHSTSEQGPRSTRMGMTPREVINAAIAAAHRYPVALGLFILLNQSELLDDFLGVGHLQTGGEGLTEALLKNPKVEAALAEPIRAAKAAGPARKKKKSPSEHFAVVFDNVPGAAIAHFGEERAVLMPFSGETDALFDTVPVIPMEHLLYEEKAFIARMNT